MGYTLTTTNFHQGIPCPETIVSYFYFVEVFNITIRFVVPCNSTRERMLHKHHSIKYGIGIPVNATKRPRGCRPRSIENKQQSPTNYLLLITYILCIIVMIPGGQPTRTN
ncbi:uncharacterized protein B0T23DRAFT_152201 [Neurospora hispaniola]|uniref:Uncharacterized protein n=1 Tax=Neurospora hispaniola TaxID=588809 RepID=A0AAJ0I8L0_9PEZI|nr:hypothetical protein B0T23DRAFT_152201 [Neurospora hispaniola]